MDCTEVDNSYNAFKILGPKIICHLNKDIRPKDNAHVFSPLKYNEDKGLYADDNKEVAKFKD